MKYNRARNNEIRFDKVKQENEMRKKEIKNVSGS
jgi:hypothetical protein